MSNFIEELCSLINRHSLENGSNTPDYLLASYLKQCLDTFDSITQQREIWHGRQRPDMNDDPFGIWPEEEEWEAVTQKLADESPDPLKDLAARELEREVAEACEELGYECPLTLTHEEMRNFRALMERFKAQPETASLDYAQGPAVKKQHPYCMLCNNTGWVLRNADGSTFPGMPFSHNYKPCPENCDSDSGRGFSDPIPDYDMSIGLIISNTDAEDDGA